MLRKEIILFFFLVSFVTISFGQVKQITNEKYKFTLTSPTGLLPVEDGTTILEFHGTAEKYGKDALFFLKSVIPLNISPIERLESYMQDVANIEAMDKEFIDSMKPGLPVYRENLDNIIGVLFRRELEPFLESPIGFDLEKLLHSPLYIPESAKLGSLLRQMQSTNNHIAIVVDEHGGMEGIVTLEDLLEEIVGEINDEFDEELRLQVINREDGTYLLDGMLAVRDANRQLKLQLPEDDGYTTLAGFLMAQTGRLLEAGEKVEYEGLTFRIERVDKRRIRRVLLTLPEEIKEINQS